MSEKIFQKNGDKIICTKSAIYYKPKWHWKPKVIMTKRDNAMGRWTQKISKKTLVEGLIPFYLLPIKWIKEQGDDIVISRIDGDNNFLVIPVDQILQSPKRIEKGILTKVLFDRDLKHLNFKQKKENAQ